MMKYGSRIGLLLILFSGLPAPVSPAQPPAHRRNIQIQVHFRSMGFKEQNRVPYVTRTRGQETQLLVVMDGMEGSIFLGKEVPYVRWFQNYLHGEGYLAESVEFRKVGTRLNVAPVIRGNGVEITLTPEVSYETEDGRGTIAVTKLSTTVWAASGQTVEIGRVARTDEFEDRFYRRASGEAVEISLTPKVMDW